mmetsp:Transcript_24970/g.74941  ORF Transcript_24970/g.74941 Transcript_24970/m.74941 type:complete len:228 (+) Transcript_24970:254-937(+)
MPRRPNSPSAAARAPGRSITANASDVFARSAGRGPSPLPSTRKRVKDPGGAPITRARSEPDTAGSSSVSPWILRSCSMSRSNDLCRLPVAEFSTGSTPNVAELSSTAARTACDERQGSGSASGFAWRAASSAKDPASPSKAILLAASALHRRAPAKRAAGARERGAHRSARTTVSAASRLDSRSMAPRAASGYTQTQRVARRRALRLRCSTARYTLRLLGTARAALS